MSEVDFEGPKSARARAVVEYLTASVEHPFATLDHASYDGRHDVVDLTVEPQLSQDRAVPIQPTEAVRLVFALDDQSAPRVHARRADFPIDLVHTNRERDADGLYLCAWEEGWTDMRRRLTPQALIERIRDWFTRTALGTIHQRGQRVEPLIPSTSSTLVIPAGTPQAPWRRLYSDKYKEQFTLLLDASPDSREDAGEAFELATLTVELATQTHTSLRPRPYTLAGLAQLAADMDSNLLALLGDWLRRPEQLGVARTSRLLLLVTIPIAPAANAAATSNEVWAFNTNETLSQLGELLGKTLTEPGVTVPTVVDGPVGQLDNIFLYGWRVVRRLDRAAARQFASTSDAGNASLVAIGAGAIGSNVIVNAARAGVGPWTVIDDDIVLPHNTVRQAQGNGAIGFPKALALQHEINGLLAEADARGIRADFLLPGDEAATVQVAYHGARLVIDFSASPSVLGRIADLAEIRRAASVFFSPNGNDLVVLAEDVHRTLRLDEIEAQYFLAAAAYQPMKGHLDEARIDRLRYANACQDLSRPLPPWQVQTLCGIASGRLVALLEGPDADARAWRLHPPTGSVRPVSLALAKVHRHQFEGLRVTITEEVLTNIRRLRQEAAPNETGGVLIGTFDLVRAVLHVVTALRAPPDSRQAPTYFVRGAAELRQAVNALEQGSAGMLTYVGEWHSHPDQTLARPSGDDEVVFAYLQTHLGPTGSPYVIAICNDRETWMRAGWQSTARGEGTVAHVGP